jgi:light-harvesting complex 1 alpha chain
MWRIWMIFDPRRALIGVLAFAFLMVLINHFVQLSTPRYGDWLNAPRPTAAAAVQDDAATSRVASTATTAVN